MDAERPPLRFGVFEFDAANRQLRRAGVPVELGNRYFDALALLLREPGALVTKDRFMDEVWRGVPVTDEALTQCIRTLRRALGERAGEARFIATVPKHGYRFVAPIGGSPDGPIPLASRLTNGGLAASATLGGGMAGALGGLLYGVFATSGGGGMVLVLLALGAALGVLGGAGVGLGMAAASSWGPGKAVTLVAGGAMGGMLVGAFGRLLGLDGFALLTGARLGPVTGLFEGLLLGAAAGVAVPLAGRISAARAIAAAAGIGMMTGAIIGASGGRMLGGSLAELAARFPASGLVAERLALPGGWIIVSIAAEAALFCAAIVAVECRRLRRC